MRRLSIFLVGVLIVLSGCSTQTTVESSNTGTASNQVSEETATSEVQDDTSQEESLPIRLAYSSCDSDAIDPLTEADRPEWRTFRFDCPTDRVAAPEALPAMELGAEVEPCMLEDKSPPRLNAISRGVPDEDYVVGFPRSESPWLLPDTQLKIAFVPVDFIDYKDDVDPLSFAEPAAKMMDEFYAMYTRGAVSFEWYLHDSWITINESIYNFVQSESTAAAQWSQQNRSVVDGFWQAAIEASDPFVDFTDVDMVYFVMPRDQDAAQEFNLWPPSSNAYQTEEGDIRRGFVPGSYQFRPDKSLWAFWIHETLHYFRLPDLYWHDQNSIKRSEYTLPGAMQGYDIMTNQDGVSKALSTWLMWLAGWLEDDEIACLTKDVIGEGSIEISPVHIDDGKHKSVIVPMSETKAVVIESRRKTQFDVDKEVNRSRDGVIVYVVDTEIQNGSGLATVIAPKGRTLVRMEEAATNGDINLDAVLYEGNFLEIGGIKIEVASAWETSDTINISLVEDWQSGDEPEYVCFTKANRDLAVDYLLPCPIVF